MGSMGHKKNAWCGVLMEPTSSKERERDHRSSLGRERSSLSWEERGGIAWRGQNLGMRKEERKSCERERGRDRLCVKVMVRSFEWKWSLACVEVMGNLPWMLTLVLDVCKGGTKGKTWS